MDVPESEATYLYDLSTACFGCSLATWHFSKANDRRLGNKKPRRINLAERLWIVPASRMKGGKEHRVPLSGAAMAVVETMAEYRQGDYLFLGRGGGPPPLTPRCGTYSR